MKTFFERLKLNIERNPDRVVLRSADCPDGITYRQLDEMSGKVCRFLKEKQIGKEDFVMLLMPREVSAYISVIGVWKCGAAMILLEEDYSSERVNYIKSDLNCKFVITQDVFDEMMQGESCRTYAIPNVHDACYATYTSGSTGNPKGILHEFGKLDTFDYDYRQQLLPIDGEENFAIVTPLNFGPSIRNAITSLLYGKCLYVVPRHIVKNPKLLLCYFNEHEITETSVTCSFFKAYSFASKKMKNVFVHSEPCTGVYEKGVNVINLYTLSEVVFPMYTFQIDKPYDKAPLGYANPTVKIAIVNENGETAKPFEIGEIVVEDPFTRGYIHLPEKTAEVFSDGLFHSGDLGYCDEHGMAFLCGRKDDMIKINGNRIEPMEIEATLKKVLSVNNALAKGCVDEKRSFIAAYFLRDELAEKGLLDENGAFRFSPSDMKRKIRDLLPDYMIPSYYLVLDSYPKNENGKIARKDFPTPCAEDFLQSYVAPRNEREAYFCHLFETVLDLEKVGVNDDFYQIGGDSITAMRALSRCDEYELTVAELYHACTPKNLSKIACKRQKNVNVEAENALALAVAQPLLPEQKATFETQMEFPDYILNNITRFFRLNKAIDIDRFKTAVNHVLRHHPVFSSVLVNEGGVEKICYKPVLFREIAVKTISPAELKKIKEEPCKPFVMEHQLLYRSAIYRCEGAFYFYLEIHHLMTDGTSLKLLLDEIARWYQKGALSLPVDGFFLLLQNKAEEFKQNDKTPRQIRELYQVDDYVRREDNSIRLDRLSTDLIPSKYVTTLRVDKTAVLTSDGYREYKGNVFFLTCFLETMANYNKRNKAFSLWTYSGREQSLEQTAHGMLVRTLPMGLDFGAQADTKSAFETVKESVAEQIACTTAFVNGMTDEFMFSPYFVYQKDVLYSEASDDVFEERIDSPGGCLPFEFHLIDNRNEDCFRCVVKYSAGQYDKQSIEDFCTLFETTVRQKIDENL